MDTAWGFFPLFWIFPLLCAIFMVIMMLMMFRRGAGGCMPFGGAGPRAGSGGETPRQILDRRYAGDEITRERYDQMKRDIAS